MADFNDTKQQASNISVNYEIGPEKGLLHLDGVIQFKQRTLLDLRRITDLYNTSLRGLSAGIYINIRYVPNSIQIVFDYSRKDNNKLI